MATQVQLRRGTSTQNDSFTGAQGELTFDTTNKRVRIHDGATAGGFELKTENAGGDTLFATGEKAIFGAGSDLQIYHDGANSVINEGGTGELRLGGTNLRLGNGGLTETYLLANNQGAVTLYYDNNPTLATTATGVDVTGTVTADALTLDSTDNTITFGDSNTTIRAASSTGGVLQSKAYNGFSFTQTKTSDKTRFNIADGGDISFYEDTGTTAKFFWDASAERLGLGTSSPSALLDVVSSGTGAETIAEFGNGNISKGLTIETDGNLDWGFNATNRNLTFSTSQTERMRITSSGNLLVGKTSDNNAVAGTTISNSGIVKATRTDWSLLLNRLAGDGDIALFQKDGVSVGSISSASGGSNPSKLQIGTGSSKINFDDTFDEIYPVSDNVTTLGDPGARFNNLYLSGGVYLGGTGSANKLDSYEEGIWMGILTGSNSAPSTAITATGTYTKIGRSVTAVISFSNKDSTGVSGNIIVTGLPFTASAGGVGAGWHSRSNTGTGTTNGVMSYISSTNDLILINGLGSAITWVSTGTGTYAGYSITYKV